MAGYIYIVRNKDLYKIGMTHSDINRRIRQLKPVEKESDFEVIITKKVDNYMELERDLHRTFKDQRIPQTEYFRLEEFQLENAKTIIKQTPGESEALGAADKDSNQVNSSKQKPLLIRNKDLFVSLAEAMSGTTKNLSIDSERIGVEVPSYSKNGDEIIINHESSSTKYKTTVRIKILKDPIFRLNGADLERSFLPEKVPTLEKISLLDSSVVELRITPEDLAAGRITFPGKGWLKSNGTKGDLVVYVRSKSGIITSPKAAPAEDHIQNGVIRKISNKNNPSRLAIISSAILSILLFLTIVR